MGKWSERQLLIVTSAVALVVVVALTFLVVMARQSVAAEQAKNEELRQKNTELEQKKDKIDNVRRDMQRMRDNFERFKRQLPTSQELPALLKAFERMAEKSSIRRGIFGYSAVQPAPPPPGQQPVPFREYEIRLPVTGSYQEFGRFINEIEKYKRFMRVDSIMMGTHITGSTSGSMTMPGPLECSGEIKVKTFTYESPTAAAPAKKKG